LTPYPHPNLEPYPYSYQQKTDDINKHKPDQTKPNNSFAGDGAPVKKKMVLEKTISYWKVLVQIWFEFYKKKFVVSPTFNGAAAKNLKLILLGLENISKEKGFEWNEAFAKESLLHFLTKAYSDEWLKCNFLLNNLASKFDAIINFQNYGTAKDSKQQAPADISVVSAFSKIDAMPG
jgi:hypothetical protein